VIVDCIGKRCPVPVIELARALPSVDVGVVVEVLSDDAAAAHDIPAWCRLRGQEYVGAEERASGSAYLVRRTS
jgi:cysteine desulfurase